MTLPSQRTNAVLNVRDFLLRLSSPYGENAIKGVKTAVRAEARALLKHYPTTLDMAHMEASFDEKEAEKHLKGQQ